VGTRYTRDGGVVPSHVPGRPPELVENEHEEKYGLYKGYIKKVVYKDDSENISGELEYVVNVKGQDYFGVQDCSAAGGIFANHTRIRKGVEAIKPEDVALAKGDRDKVPNDKKDGEFVRVLMLEGDSNFPIIIGSARHTLANENPDWHEPTTDEGIHERYEFQGLEFLIDKESNFSITHVGRKNLVGGLAPVVENPKAITPNKSKIEFKGNGDFFLDLNDSLLRLSMLKETAKVLWEMGQGLNVAYDGIADKALLQTAFGDSFSISATDGIQGSTPAAGGTKLSLKNGIAEMEGSGGKVKLGTNKVGIGSSAGELVDICIKIIDEIVKVINGQTAETHNGNLGYPTGPPINAGIYPNILTALGTLKATLTLLKGGI